MKNFGRNFIIAFLMVLAIYQTGELWFEDFSDHNFFNLLDQRESSNTNNMAYTLDRLIVNIGDNKVIAKSSNIYRSEYKNSFDKAVAKALTEGSLTENTGNVDWNSVLDNRTIIYEYNCSFNGIMLENFFNVNSEICSEIKSFDTIVISPRADNSFMRVIFFDSSDKSSSYVELKSNSIIGSCFEASTNFAQNDEEIYYISSVKNGFNIFSSNEFLPQSKTEGYSYNAIEPHFTSNDISMIEENANIFFNNAIAGNYTRNSDGYTFSDETTVVRFYENNLVEYFNYDTKNGSNSLSANYSAALNFIEQDRFITNEIYLHSYSYDDGHFTFYFNYKLNDMHLVPGEEICNSTGLNSFIEVTTSQGRVDRYRKYGCRYTLSDKNMLTANVDFIGAIDSIYASLYSHNEETKPVDNISLAYIGRDKNFGLSWIVEIDGQEYIVDMES